MIGRRRYMRGSDFPPVRAADGRPLCRFCRGPLPKGRRSWCSQSCLDQVLLRVGGAQLRRAVFERDRGVCVACGLDCGRLERVLSHAQKAAKRYRANPEQVCVDALAPIGYLLRWESTRGKQTLWQADHIVPVAEGGGACGLENIRTLCLPCHRRVTNDIIRCLGSRRGSQGDPRVHSLPGSLPGRPL